MRRLTGACVALVLLVVACDAESSPSPTPMATPMPTPTATATADPTPARSPTPTPTPEPELSLEPPDGRDERQVDVSVEHAVAPDGSGRIVVTVTSLADSRIDDLVLRWPTELADSLFLAPFQPTEDRIREGGDPLVQPWTKWVVGPGERGEPEGTTSLGYGPLLPGATLEIPLYVTRVAEGSVAFDLQVLADNDLLSLANGEPAELRVEVP